MPAEPLLKARVRVFASLEELSRQAAAKFRELARSYVAEKGTFNAALSGGSTPRRLYELLASRDLSAEIPWERVHLFQVDERCVPPDDPESNYRMIRETLLEHIPLPGTNFHRMAAEVEDREGARLEYAAELGRILKPKKGEIPRFDLILLGMGPDGHIASLFPGTAGLHDHSAWVRPNFVDKFKAYRLTLTFPVLNAAAWILFLVSGTEKAETLRQVLEGPWRPEELPAQYVHPAKGQVEWYVDQHTARLLTTALRGVL
jgi:6-phosphogluconolactonase